MARTPAQRGRIGTWLVQARLAREYDTQAAARREIERLTGWRIPQSQYAEWESGRRVPSEAALERLQAFYGTHEETGPSVTGGAGLQAMRQERESVEARLRALESELESLRAPQEGEASQGQSAPRVEAGSGH